MDNLSTRDPVPVQLPGFVCLLQGNSGCASEGQWVLTSVSVLLLECVTQGDIWG